MAQAVDTILVGVDVNLVSTDQKHALGLVVNCDDGTERTYIRAGAAIVANAALTQDFAEGPYDWQATSAVDTPIFGVAPVAIADNSFGFVITKGVAFVLVAAAPGAAGALLTPSAVAGTLDDAVAAAGNALGAASGVGVVLIADDTPSAGIAKVLLT